MAKKSNTKAVADNQALLTPKDIRVTFNVQGSNFRMVVLRRNGRHLWSGSVTKTQFNELQSSKPKVIEFLKDKADLSIGLPDVVKHEWKSPISPYVSADQKMVLTIRPDEQTFDLDVFLKKGAGKPTRLCIESGEWGPKISRRALELVKVLVAEPNDDAAWAFVREVVPTTYGDGFYGFPSQTYMKQVRAEAVRLGKPELIAALNSDKGMNAFGTKLMVHRISCLCDRVDYDTSVFDLRTYEQSVLPWHAMSVAEQDFWMDGDRILQLTQAVAAVDEKTVSVKEGTSLDPYLKDLSPSKRKAFAGKTADLLLISPEFESRVRLTLEDILGEVVDS